MSLDFSVTFSLQPYHDPGVDSAPRENEYQEHFLGVNAAGAWGWQPWQPDVMTIWEPKPPGTPWATPCLLRDSFTFYPLYFLLWAGFLRQAAQKCWSSASTSDLHKKWTSARLADAGRYWITVDRYVAGYVRNMAYLASSVRNRKGKGRLIGIRVFRHLVPVSHHNWEQSRALICKTVRCFIHAPYFEQSANAWPLRWRYGSLHIWNHCHK
jgi:hypothetical protein